MFTKNLCNRGFGATYSGSPFSNVHGDLVTEYLNKEIKSGHGPLKFGFSTNVLNRQKWLKNAHIHANLQTVNCIKKSSTNRITNR